MTKGEKFKNINRQVSEIEGKNLAEELGVMFFEASAKTGSNVKGVFTKLASSLPGLENTEMAHDPDCMKREDKK